MSAFLYIFFFLRDLFKNLAIIKQIERQAHVCQLPYNVVLNLSKLNIFLSSVFFRRREIEVYPDTYPDKPPVGEELNKKAEITLEKVWPNDKTSHKPITVS